MPKKSTRTATRTAAPAAKVAPTQPATIAPTAPQPSASPAAARLPVTPGMGLSIRTPMDAQLSPDGRYVAFVLYERVPERPKARGKLWIAPVEGGEPRPLATGDGDDASPRWSPDGKQLVFLSTRPDERHPGKSSEKSGDKADEKSPKLQLHLASIEDGEARDVRRLCTMPNGASLPAWSPDGTRIAFTSLEGEEPSKDPIVLGPDRHRRLWTVRPGYDAAEPVTPPDVTIWECAWSPDSRKLAVFFSTGPGETDYYRGQIGLVDAGGGAMHQVSQLTRQAGALTWSPDGARLAYISGEWSDRGIIGGDVYTMPIKGMEGGKPKSLKNLTPSIGFSPSWVRWTRDGKQLLYAAVDGLSSQVGLLDEATGRTTTLEADFALGEALQPRLSPSADLRRVAVTHSSPTHPADVFVGEIEGNHINWRRLSRFNPIAEETWAPQESRRIRYKSVDGWQIEAIFHPPAVKRFEGKPPLVLVVHGGPSGAHTDTWGGRNGTQVLTSAGYAVLRPNPRGSMGRGVAFADAVLGDMGGKDLQDVLRGVDYAIEQGWVDGDRIAIMGWSYGGFMTAWAVTQTPRFKAAMMGAGVSDFHSFHAQSNIPDWDMRAIGCDPCEQPEAYRARSAITFAKHMVTPTLILHGENDLCVPVNQAYGFYRALLERKVPTELVVYPREGHGLGERDHIKDMEERILRWMDTYL
jgi:dipeptidyl aminopeptidase/acylaminoacyl peptidase